MSGQHISVKNALYEQPGPRTRRITAVFTAISIIIFGILLAVIVRQFWLSGQLSASVWYFFARHTTWIFLGKGFLGTFAATLTAGIIAFAAAFLMMLGKISKIKVLHIICSAFVEMTRGIPTLLFIYFFFLVVPLTGINLLPILKIAIPVGISASGVVAESMRSGVNAVPKGQREAALSLGMSESHLFFKIIFPQGLRYIIPSLVAELVIVVKDTTFAYIVNFPDLMQNAKVLISNYDAMLPVYLVVAVIYVVINFLLNKVAVSIAHRQSKATKN